jgi:hypothetical protein
MSKARCARCGDIIESKSVHDFQQCKCESIFIDGGDEYLRCGFSKPSDIEIWNEKTKKFEPMKTITTNDNMNIHSKNVMKDYGKNKICEKLSRKTLRRND